jgi:LysM repeat protein
MPMDPREEIRYLFARRLARETGSHEALAYFPTNYSGEYETLLAELRDGRDETLPVGVRAKNLFAAAVMTRTNGMELFGTELEPDWAIFGGEYDFGFTWQSRATNKFQAKINLAGTDEIERASSRYVDPEKRFHYRWQAAALAWEAAQLMPDNSDETARVLCTAGTWLKDRDPPAADKFYKALVRRCRKTALGDEADKIRWFPAQDIAGNRPRLETIEITPGLTSMTGSNYEGVFSEEFPVPGRQYSVHEAEDVFIIARAVQRLGYPMTVEQILQANPGLKRSPISEGRLIMIPKVPGESSESGATNSADVISVPPMFSGTNYTVRAGDSIAKIAKITGVTVKAILDANPDLDSMRIKVGQTLVIPQPMKTNSPSMRNAAGAGN